MNTTIKSSRVCRPIPRVSPLRRLALAAATAALVASGPAFAQTIYWLSGTATAESDFGSWDKPAAGPKLLAGDMIILDANKIENFNGMYTPKDAIDRNITFASVVTNGASSPYMTWAAGDPTLYRKFTPYVRLNDLMEKTPWLETMLPTFFTQSERVYISGVIGQDNRDSPDFIKAYTTNPFNTWPVSLYSSDALKEVNNTYIPRPDMQNAAWVILTAKGENVQLMRYFGEYLPATSGGTRPFDGSYSMITLEHIIFYGGVSTGEGGAFAFMRSDGLGEGANSRAIVQVKGDVAFVNNRSSTLGGGVLGQETIQFDGNVYFVGNQVGMGWYENEGIASFNRGSTGSTNYSGDGGAMRIGSGSQTITFKKDAIFIGNLAADMGGSLSLHNTSTLRFQGKTVFMGNQAGLLMRPGAGLNGGNGGAIVYGTTGANYAYFTGESYFIANQTSGFGGVLASGNGDADNNGHFMFSAAALFTDNVSGVKPEITTVYSDMESQMSGGAFPYPANVATVGTDNGIWSGNTIVNVFSGTLKGDGAFAYGAKIRGGGAFYGIGTLLFFDDKAPATFLRNSTNGSGGSLLLAKNSTAGATGRIDGFGALFYNDATFTGNVAAINGGAISAGTYGPVKSDIGEYDTATTTAAAVYFGKAGVGSTLTMHGNISYTAPESLSTDPSASVSGSAFSVLLSTGTTVRAGNGTTVNDIPVFGGGAAFVTGGMIVESFYSFKNNQTDGSGGALFIGSGATPALVTTRMGYAYGLVLNALDWKDAGTYSQAGDFALFQDNVAVRDGGAILANDGAMLYIGSGASFVNNYAGGEGGAIALAMPSGQITGMLGTAFLDLRARVADITFKGNRAGVAIDTSTVDLDAILDPLNTTNDGVLSDTGYMTVDPATGRANDIYIGRGVISGTEAGDVVSTIIRMDAYEGMKIYFDGGIAMDHSGVRNAAIFINTTLDQTGTSLGTTSTSAGNLVTNPILSNTTPTGLVVLNNVSADFDGMSVVGNGTLRIQGTSNDLHWGSGTNTARAGASFVMQGNATLEANATINASSILIAGGTDGVATLRVLGSGATHGAESADAGALTLNSGTGGVTFTGTVNLAGNGRINTGVSSIASVASISLGDVGHGVAQTLTIGRNASTLAGITLTDNAMFSAGLFSGGGDLLRAGSITLGANTIINLTSFSQGTFTLATADSAINSSIFAIDYKGTALNNTTNTRMQVSAAVSGNNLELAFTANNLTLDWNGSGGSGSWTLASGNMANGDTNYVLGDVVRFGVSGPAAGTVSVDENIGLSGMVATGNYTFNGGHGITTQATALSNGQLTLNSGLLTFANATGAGQRNEFTGGILINAGTLAAGTEAQLGAALSQITFANTANNGAALLVTGDMLLDGAANLAPQQLTVGGGNTANIATSTDGAFYVINNAVAGNGGVFNIGGNSTLNLKAEGDMFFLNNTAAQGGALSLGDNASANIDVAGGKTVMFGLQGDRVLRTAANVSAEDSIYGAASSVIEKNGLGNLSINSNSSNFEGALNVNAGGVMLGEGSRFGNAASRITVASSGVLGGAATIGGDVTVNGGKLSVDTGVLFGRSVATAAQTLTIMGSLDLNDASLFYNVLQNQAQEYSIDMISTGGAVNITGATQFDFRLLSNFVLPIVNAGTNAVTWEATVGDIINGPFELSDSIDTTLLTTNTAWSGPTYITTHDELNAIEYLSDENFVMSKNGDILDASRYEVAVGYQLINSVVVTDEYGTFISQTNFYDASSLMMKADVNNMVVHWTGESGTLWNSIDSSWYIPEAVTDKTFVIGDSVIFGAKDTNGISYEGNDDSRRSLVIEPSAVFVADVRFTGSDNWTVTGGLLVTNAGGNNYKDENGLDLSTGQLLLDEYFTGTVSFLNDGVSFNGIYVDTGNGMEKTADVAIRNGTMIASAGAVKGNLIENNSTLIFQQSKNEDFADTQMYGNGTIMQRGDSKITMKQTGIIKIGNYFLEEGTLSVDYINSLQVSGTFTTEPGATLMLKEGMVVGTLINKGILTKAPWDSSNSLKAPTGPDPLRPREPGIGLSTSPIIVNGNFRSEEGIIELNTYRDALYVNNLFVTGNSSGTSTVVIRNITSMDSDASITGTVFGTGTYFMPAGMPASANPRLAAKRDTPVATTLGAQRDLKLVMDWEESEKYLPSATIGSIVPFVTWTDDTYVVTTSSTITTMISGTAVISSTLASSSTESLNVDSKTVHFYDAKGNVANLGMTGSLALGSGTILTSGSMVESGTTVVMDIIVVSSTYNVKSLSTSYAPSEIDYSESRDNYNLVQGRDGNWYFRNSTIAPVDADLPLIGAAPVMADMLAQGTVRAFYEHVSARHDALEKGWNVWTNYTHTEDRLRKEYYSDTMIKQDIFQAGVDYVLTAKGDDDYSATPSISIGGAVAFTTAEAVRNQTTTNPEILIDGTNAYSHTTRSTLRADANTLNAYASARWWRFYLDILLQCNLKSSYKTYIDANVPFDQDGFVKGSRLGTSAEFGIITNPKGLGQLEIYVQATSQKHSFDSVSSISEDSELTNAEGYNPIYDPDSPNGRRYSFTAPTSFRAEGGLRWGSHLKVNEKWAVRPWGSLAGGRISNNSYVITLDEHDVINDMNGSYFTVQGGAAALFKRNWQFYFTLGWSGGDASNNYTLSTGMSHHW